MTSMIATLEIVRFVAAIALCVALFALAVYGLYRNIKETAETAIREELEQAIKEASKPVVKVEIQTKGKWQSVRGYVYNRNNRRSNRDTDSFLCCDTVHSMYHRPAPMET